MPKNIRMILMVFDDDWVWLNMKIIAVHIKEGLNLQQHLQRENR